MKQSGILGTAAILLSAAMAFAQLDLGALYTRTVKTGQPWAAIDTKVNDLTLNVQVNRGVVTTVATIEYTPGKGTVSEYVCEPEVCSAIKCEPSVCRNRVVKELVLDSLETSTGFSQADNTVITDMYLWVGEKKVKADLQDRALASAQYEDIVKRRRDPALIETWGNGYYNLRIFPNESGISRKIEIEFVQGMENEGSDLQTVLPVLHRLVKIASSGAVDYASLPNRTIGNVTLTATAVDGRTYQLAWEGLGSGEVGATPLRLQGKEVAELKAGKLTGSASGCAGCLTPWTAEKAGVSYFGAKTSLIAKQIRFEAEPDERHFLLDVDGKDTLVASRARKVTLLSLKAYASGSSHQANLAFADGKGGLVWVFPGPVPMDADNLRKAYEALKAWNPNADADAHATLRAYAKTRGAGSGSPSVAYLINNDSTPYYRWTYGPTGAVVSGSQADYEAWEKAQSAKEDETLAALQASRGMLFGFWNDYRLNRLASATGGLQVGALHGYIYYPMGRGGIVTDIAPDKAAPLADIHLPPLFGPERPDAWSISALEVKATGLAIDQLVVLQTQRSWGWNEAVPMSGGIVASDAMLPYQRPSLDTVVLRLSGRYQGSGSVTFAVTGIWGGLRFSQEFKADLPASSGAGLLGAGIWAYQQTEYWGRSMVKIGLDAYKALGREYHIVNRQMSLLALEPGVPLWTEMPAKDGGTASGGRELTSGAPASDGMIAVAGQTTAASLDKASLEDILNGTVGVNGPVAALARGAGDLTLRRIGGSVSLAWALPGAGSEAATFRILDLAGKTVAELVGTRTAAGYAAEWRNAGKPGLHLVVARAGGRTAVKRLAITP